MTRTPEELQQQTLKAKVPGIDNAWILCSGVIRDDDTYGGPPQVRATMSFLYDAGSKAAEWEPQYGPIQIWTKCEEGAENSRPHYFYDYVLQDGWNWSQLAVDKAALPDAFAAGNYEHIFAELKAWSAR